MKLILGTACQTVATVATVMQLLWLCNNNNNRVALGLGDFGGVGSNCPTPGAPCCDDCGAGSTPWIWPNPGGSCPTASLCCGNEFVGSRDADSPGYSTCCWTTYYTLVPCPTGRYDEQLCGCPLFIPRCTSTGCASASPSCTGKPSTTTTTSSLKYPSDKALALERVTGFDALERPLFEQGNPDTTTGTRGSTASGEASAASDGPQTASTAATAVTLTCNVTGTTGVTQQSCGTAPTGCAVATCITAGQIPPGGCGYLPAPDALNYSSMTIADLAYPPTTSKRTFPCLHVMFPLSPTSTYSVTLACKYNRSGAASVTALQLKLQNVCNSEAVTGSDKPLFWQATGLDSNSPKARWSTKEIVRVADGVLTLGLDSALSAVQQVALTQADRAAETFNIEKWATFRNASKYGRDHTNTTGNSTKVATAGAGAPRRLLLQCLPPPAFARDMFDQDVCNQLNVDCPKGAKFAKVCVPVGQAKNALSWYNRLVTLLNRGTKVVLGPEVGAVVQICKAGMKAYKISCLDKKTAADCSALDDDVNIVCDQNNCNC